MVWSLYYMNDCSQHIKLGMIMSVDVVFQTNGQERSPIYENTPSRHSFNSLRPSHGLCLMPVHQPKHRALYHIQTLRWTSTNRSIYKIGIRYAKRDWGKKVQKKVLRERFTLWPPCTVHCKELLLCLLCVCVVCVCVWGGGGGGGVVLWYKIA